MIGDLARWQLTAKTLESLLCFLDPDPDQAARGYERLRAKLIRLFDWRGCAFPEDLADETINRVARKLEEGTEIRSADPYSYFAGVAHRVFCEVLRRRKKQREALAEIRHIDPEPRPAPEAEARLSALDRCLVRLSPAERKLIVSFYQGEKRTRIDRRKRLASALDISINALRIRAHRLRLRLESCVRTFLSAVT